MDMLNYFPPVIAILSALTRIRPFGKAILLIQILKSLFSQSLTKISRLVFGLFKAFKAPGPDGLHAGFFHRFWLVGDSVCDEVKNIFTSEKIPEYLN